MHASKMILNQNAESKGTALIYLFY